MSNAFYNKGKEKILQGGINFSTANIKAVLVKNTYPQDLAADEFLSSVSTYVLNTPQTLTGKTIVTGVFDAADIVFSTVAAGDVSEGVVLYIDSGSPATSALIAYIDTITGFPLTTNGGDVTVQRDNGTYKIFSL